MTVNNYKPSFWGPSAWKFLHAISFAYPSHPSQDEKKHHIDLILNLQFILPCEACRQHVIDNLRTMKFSINNMKNRETFSKFVYDLHNEVNVMLGKPIFKTYSQVKDMYN